MALVTKGPDIINIKGSIAGNVFSSDSSGLHCRANPRRVRSCSPAQKIQRDAFTKARAFSKDNRVVSYNIYRALTGLPLQLPPPDYEIPRL